MNPDWLKKFEDVFGASTVVEILADHLVANRWTGPAGVFVKTLSGLDIKRPEDYASSWKFDTDPVGRRVVYDEAGNLVLREVETTAERDARSERESKAEREKLEISAADVGAVPAELLEEKQP